MRNIYIRYCIRDYTVIVILFYSNLNIYIGWQINVLSLRSGHSDECIGFTSIRCVLFSKNVNNWRQINQKNHVCCILDLVCTFFVYIIILVVTLTMGRNIYTITVICYFRFCFFVFVYVFIEYLYYSYLYPRSYIFLKISIIFFKTTFSIHYSSKIRVSLFNKLYCLLLL